MQPSDIIALLGILTSLFISTITLLYNAKVVRDSLKPDVQVYLDYLSSNSIQYLVIKNFGKTGAYIKNIKHNLTDVDFINNYLKNANMIYLAPNQVIFLPFSSRELKKFLIFMKYYLSLNTNMV